MPRNSRSREILGYTLVMHSGGGYAGKPGFKRAVEERAINSQTELDKIKRVGGLVLADYTAASERAEQENFPDLDSKSIYPNVRGQFSALTIDGLRIYIPRPTPEPLVVLEQIGESQTVNTDGSETHAATFALGIEERIAYANDQWRNRA